MKEKKVGREVANQDESRLKRLMSEQNWVCNFLRRLQMHCFFILFSLNIVVLLHSLKINHNFLYYYFLQSGAVKAPVNAEQGRN